MTACPAAAATTRTTRASWWERAFIAPYWVNFHAEHHLFMHVPCWRLPKLHRAVQATAEGERMEVAGSYDAVRRLTPSMATDRIAFVMDGRIRGVFYPDRSGN